MFGLFLPYDRARPPPPLMIHAHPAPGLPLWATWTTSTSAATPAHDVHARRPPPCKIENWAEHHYPSFICVSPPSSSSPGLSFDPSRSRVLSRYVATSTASSGTFSSCCGKAAPSQRRVTHSWHVRAMHEISHFTDPRSLSGGFRYSLETVHGGLSPDIRTLDQIRVLSRAQEIPHEGAFCGESDSKAAWKSRYVIDMLTP